MFKNAKVIGANIDPEVYHRRDATIPRGNAEYVMSYSELKEFAVCPHRWMKGYREGDIKESESIKWGSLIDTLLLDSARFPEKYAVTPETYMAEGKKKDDEPVEKPWNLNSKVCQEWVKEQGDKTCIKSAMKHESDIAVARLYEDDIIAEILRESDHQVMVTAEWHDKATGIVIPVRSLLDIVPKREHPLYGQMNGDLKTCKGAGHVTWAKQVFSMGYHIQAPLYTDIYEAATGENRTDFFHILQENFAPYEIGRRLLSVEYMEMGRTSYQEALKHYCQCLKTGKWTGYDDNTPLQLSGLTFTNPEIWMFQ